MHLLRFLKNNKIFFSIFILTKLKFLILLPSWSNAKAFTILEWPDRVFIILPLTEFQSLIVESAEPLTKVPSVSKAKDQIESVWPDKIDVWLLLTDVTGVVVVVVTVVAINVFLKFRLKLI